eukprot:scaffold222955_cov18-Prasinocladus_malaysianus.AAC.1
MTYLCQFDVCDNPWPTGYRRTRRLRAILNGCTSLRCPYAYEYECSVHADHRPVTRLLDINENSATQRRAFCAASGRALRKSTSRDFECDIGQHLKSDDTVR